MSHIGTNGAGGIGPEPGHPAWAEHRGVPEEQPAISKNAQKVLERRYLKKDDAGRVLETAAEMFRRVAHALAAPEALYGKNTEEVAEIEERFYQMLMRLEFLPNSPTLMNAGRELGQLSACFVLPVGDSLEEIFEAVKQAALIHQSGGGTGFAFSRLRPARDVVRSTKGVSSGPVSFMKVFNAATETIKQGGTRRGANMGILRVDHPNIVEFINCKNDTREVTNFNISVGLTEQFMGAVERDQEYPLINPRSKDADRHLRARVVFDQIVQNAWRTGEPGIVFLDRINAKNTTPHVGEIEATNPCGEQPLHPYESCNLGSINLDKMWREADGTVELDWEKLRETVWLCIRFLDNVVDANKYPLPQIEAATRGNRRIGLGVMGWADLLYRMGVPYNSEAAIDLGRKIMRSITEEGWKASEALGKEKGSFPTFPGSTLVERYGSMRNCTATTVAPTGTISIIAGCSSGIEPIFAIAYVRNVMDHTELGEIHPYFEQVAKARGFYSEALMREVAAKGSLHEIPGIPEDVKRIFVTAHDITPEWHIRMQAAFQEWTDNAVSKTVNFPREATPEDVEQVYWLAYKLGCKGVTVYRDGSREEQVLNIGMVNRGAEQEPAEGRVELVPTSLAVPVAPKPRPDVVRGATHRMDTSCGKLYVTVNEAEGKPFEVFTQMGKSGGCLASYSEAIGRLISLSLRAGVEPDAVVKQLKGIRCPLPLWQPGGMTLSCSDAIGKALERHLQMEGGTRVGQIRLDEVGSPDPRPSLPPSMAVAAPPPFKGPEIPRKANYAEKADMHPECPECGSVVEFIEGCVVCRSCGFSRCW